MAEFESADLYFEPDDPAVCNPERFTPQQRLRNFLPRWPIKATNTTAQRASTVKYNDSTTVNGPTATRYVFTTLGDHTTTSFFSENKMSLYPDAITMLSESLDSLTRTSYSSEGQQEVKDSEDHENDDNDLVSCCGSLTYSVESEGFLHHQNLQHHYNHPHAVSTLPHADTDIYEDALERLHNQDVSTSKAISSEKKVATNNCFQTAPGDCFHPLAWVGEMFRISLASSEKRSILWSHDDDDAKQERIEDFQQKENGVGYENENN